LGTSRQEQKIQTRAKILSTAKELFIAQGFAETTSRQIASKAGIAVGTLFVHFSGKEAILAETLYSGIETCLQDAFATLPKGNTVAKLMHISRRLYSFYAEQPELSKVLLGNTIFGTGDSGDDERFSLQLELFQQWITNSIIEENIPNLNPELTAHNFMAQYFYCLYLLLKDEEPDVDKAVKMLSQLTKQIFKT